MPKFQYAFLDSGSGGLPYLAQLVLHESEASCVYVADTAHFPYGEKTREEVISFAEQTVSRMIDIFSPDVIIIACNTISVAALEPLRARFNIPFVGTVPAIKTAASISRSRTIGLWATERTVHDPYTQTLIDRFASDCRIVRFGDSELISRIENELVSADAKTRLEAVRPAIDRFRAEGVDTIVLACTHFLHVDAEIREAAGPLIRVIDSREGVVTQALRLVPPCRDISPFRACYSTGGDERFLGRLNERYALYSKRFGVSWGGFF